MQENLDNVVSVDLSTSTWDILDSENSADSNGNGPYSADDLKDLWDDSVIDANTLVRAEEFASLGLSWLPIRSIPHLFSYLDTDTEALLAADDGNDSTILPSYIPSHHPSSHAGIRPVPSIDDLEKRAVSYTAPDGTEYEYDFSLGQYVPKIDEELILQQQSAYGTKFEDIPCSSEDRSDTRNSLAVQFMSNATSSDSLPSIDSAVVSSALAELDTITSSSSSLLDKEQKKEQRRQRRKRAMEHETAKEGENEGSSSDITRKRRETTPKRNSHVYFSGVPADVNTGELEEFFSRCGIIKIDDTTLQPRIKLYRDESGQIKGDGIVTYLKEPSVQLALDLLDGRELRIGYPIRLERAQFSIDPQWKSQEKGRRKKKSVASQLQEAALSWGDNKSSNPLKALILRHMFTLEQEAEPGFFEDLAVELYEEFCSFGEVQALVIFPGTIDGVISVKFSKSEDALQCFRSMSGRFFDQRQIVCEFWDRKTDYSVNNKKLILQVDAKSGAVSLIEHKPKKTKKPSKSTLEGGEVTKALFDEAESDRTRDDIGASDDDDRLEEFSKWLDEQSSSSESEEDVEFEERTAQHEFDSESDSQEEGIDDDSSNDDDNN